MAIRKAAGSSDHFRVDLAVPCMEGGGGGDSTVWDVLGDYHTKGINVAVDTVRVVGAPTADDHELVPVGVEHVGEAIVSCLRTDRPDGLYTTVVVDECEAALGLVYSSKESVIESMKCGRGVYVTVHSNDETEHICIYIFM